jgi:stress response protein SCP2
MGKSVPDIDCDASVIMLDESGKIRDKNHLIYYGNLKSVCGSVKHTGDNLTGDGDGDDEQILVDLSRIPSNVNKLVFVVNIYDCVRRKQDFGLIRNAFIRVVNQDTNQEIMKYNLSEDYAGMTTLLVGEIYRYNNDWKFAALGQGTRDDSLSKIVSKYN